jgi:hypothetical protein
METLRAHNIPEPVKIGVLRGGLLLKDNSKSRNAWANCFRIMAGFMPIGIGLSVLFWLLELWIHVSRIGDGCLMELELLWIIVTVVTME